MVIYGNQYGLKALRQAHLHRLWSIGTRSYSKEVTFRFQFYSENMDFLSPENSLFLQTIDFASYSHFHPPKNDFFSKFSFSPPPKMIFSRNFQISPTKCFFSKFAFSSHSFFFTKILISLKNVFY